MKKSLIALSVAAALGGVAGTASAQTTATELVFNQSGVGHILIVPYFSTQSGNATLLNIVNTDTVNGKAVKIRFRGASNSDDVFDFQLFLSPADVWTANISKGASGLSRLTTDDKSCTLPANVNQDFITSRLNTVDLSGDALANETREGYVEILTMGDIPSVSGTTSVYFATKHNAAGVAPCTAALRLLRAPWAGAALALQAGRADALCIDPPCAPPEGRVLEEVLAALARSGAALAVRPPPSHLQPEPQVLERALAAGVPLLLLADARDLVGLDDLVLAVGLARRAGATAAQVLNAWPLHQLDGWLAARRDPA